MYSGTVIYSPQEASVVAKVSRKTIMDAINAQRLNATRNNRNHWVIASDDLEAWIASRVQPPAKVITTDTSNVTITQKDIEISTLKVQVNAKDATIADLRTERDDWKAQAQRSMWSRLFGS